MTLPVKAMLRSTTGAVLTGANDPPYSAPTKPIDISPKLGVPRGTIRKSQWPWRLGASPPAVAVPASQFMATVGAGWAATAAGATKAAVRASIVKHFIFILQVWEVLR